jgi:PPOX class probable FMN-dependent enzyme
MTTTTEFAKDEVIDSVEQLRELYGQPMERALTKELDHVNPLYQQFIEKSPFAVIASVGPEGVDTSPRGDAPGFVRVVDPKTLMLPDRRGNNRADTLTNIVRNPHVSLLFMIPGVGETLRVIGTARLVVRQALCETFAVGEKLPRCIIVVDVHSAYYQCQKALARSRLWDPACHPAKGQVPSAGEMLSAIDQAFDGPGFDAGYADYMNKTIY